MTHIAVRSEARKFSALVVALVLAGCATEPERAPEASTQQAPLAGSPSASRGARDTAGAPGGSASTPGGSATVVTPAPGSTPGAAATIASPVARQPSTPIDPAAPAQLPGWDDDDLAGVADALERQCTPPRLPQPRQRLCEEFRAHRTSLKAWLERRFRSVALVAENGSTQGLITGYYEPELTGSRVRVSGSQVPLYRRPTDATLRTKPTRSRIENTTLLAGSELVWVDDAIDAYFLQVQGSGRIRLRDGSTMRVGYAGDNGQTYVAIGQVLIGRGALAKSEVDAAAIKAWLRANPRAVSEVMQSNPRYIFFRELPPATGGASAGPPGSMGVALTPMRSLAVDPRRIPAGALLYLDTTHPLDERPLRRVMVAQDTGAAIVGAIRADVYWGSGSQAGLAAGRMKHRGRIWLLELRE